MPNTSRYVSNAAGTARAATKREAVARSTTATTMSASVFAVFVNQAKLAHTHQSTASTSKPCPSPAHDRWSTQNVVTCAKANPKTKSKKSSRGETRCSGPTKVSLTARSLPCNCAELLLGPFGLRDIMGSTSGQEIEGHTKQQTSWGFPDGGIAAKDTLGVRDRPRCGDLTIFRSQCRKRSFSLDEQTRPDPRRRLSVAAGKGLDRHLTKPGQCRKADAVVAAGEGDS